MLLKEFGVYDILIRASIIVGLAIMVFSNFTIILQNRKFNEQLTRLHYFHNFIAQNGYFYSSIILSLLLGLALFRVGSILKVDLASNPSLQFFNIVLLDSQKTLEKQFFIIVPTVIGSIFFVASCILYNTSQLQLGKNYSMDIDIKEGQNLITGEIYGIIRHPIYLFELTIYLSASLALLSYTLFLWTIFVHLPLTLFRIKCEDELLEYYFKDKFVEYKNRVGALLPNFIK